MVDKLFKLVQEVRLPQNFQYYDIAEKDIELLTDNALKQTR